MTVYVPPSRHHCSPPNLKPEHLWPHRPIPNGLLKREDWDKGRTMPMPTEWPRDTIWRCTCQRLWVRNKRQTVTGGYRAGGNTWYEWQPVAWYMWRVRRRATKAHKAHAALQSLYDDVTEHGVSLPQP